MVLRMWEFTVEKAYAADHYTSMCNSASMSVATKFIKELEYVKQLAEKQPITFYTIQYYTEDMSVEAKWNGSRYVRPMLLNGKIEELSMRTFDERKMNHFIQDTKHKSTNHNILHRYEIFEIVKTETFNHEYLVESK